MTIPVILDTIKAYFMTTVCNEWILNLLFTCIALGLFHCGSISLQIKTNKLDFIINCFFIFRQTKVTSYKSYKSN